jgi:ABC-type nitrate/sulfonate/bicarbonate transport system permease component
MKERLLAVLRGGSATILPLLAIIGLWQAYVVITGVNAIVLPHPAAVLQEVLDHPAFYWKRSVETLWLAGGGLAIGAACGTGAAVAGWYSGLLGAMLTPFGLIFNSVPIVALIPVAVRLFGYGTGASLSIVALGSFFPIYVFTSAGFMAVPPGSNDLMQVLGAGRLRRLRELAIPSALADWAAGLRVAAATALMTALVSEYLTNTGGLGYAFAAARNDLAIARAIAASFLATGFSVTVYQALGYLEECFRARQST